MNPEIHKTYIVRCFFIGRDAIEVEFPANCTAAEYLVKIAKIVSTYYEMGQYRELNFHGRYCDVVPK